MKKINLPAMNCVRVENTLYFISSEINMIYTLDMVTNEINFFETLPEECMLKSKLYGNIVYYDNKLILVPLCAEKIWVYDMLKNIWDGIELSKEERTIPYKFFGAVSYDEYIYMFGHYYPGIIRFNLKTYELERIQFSDSRIDNENKSKDGFFYWDYVIKDTILYTPVVQANLILKLELATGNYELLSVGSRRNKYVGIVWDGIYYWLAPRRGGKYVRWDGKSEVKEYHLSSEFSSGGRYFSGSYLVEGKVVFCGFAGKTVEFKVEEPDNVIVRRRDIVFSKNIYNDIIVLQEYNGKLFIQDKYEGEKQIEIFCEQDKLWDIVLKKMNEISEYKKIDAVTESTIVPFGVWIKWVAAKSGNGIESCYFGR